jgi:hypothetical protein
MGAYRAVRPFTVGPEICPPSDRSVAARLLAETASTAVITASGRT